MNVFSKKRNSKEDEEKLNKSAFEGKKDSSTSFFASDKETSVDRIQNKRGKRSENSTTYGGFKFEHRKVKLPETIKFYANPVQKHYCRFREFKAMPQYDLEKPIMAHAEPYDEKRRLFRQEDRTKNVSQKQFVTKFGFSELVKNQLPEAVIAKDPSKPAQLFVFRETKREKFIAGDFKVI